MADTIKDKLEELAEDGIKSAQGDEGGMTTISLDELIRADRYIKDDTAMDARGPANRIRALITSLRSPGPRGI